VPGIVRANLGRRVEDRVDAVLHRLRSEGVQLVIGSGSVAASNLGGLVYELGKRDDVPTVVVLTEAARRFVTAEAIEELGDCVVLTDELARRVTPPAHVWLPERASGVLVYPASASFVGRVASAIATDLASTVMLAAYGCPVVVVPSMNHRMWRNPLVQANVAQLRAAGMEIAQTADGTAPSVPEVVELFRKIKSSAPRGRSEVA
jgi:phosphopantothenoylcysteine synthetase/decarboxylase